MLQPVTNFMWIVQPGHGLSGKRLVKTFAPILSGRSRLGFEGGDRDENMERPENALSDMDISANAAETDGVTVALADSDSSASESPAQDEMEPSVPTISEGPEREATAQMAGAEGADEDENTPQAVFLRDTAGDLPNLRVGPGLTRLREARGETLESVCRVTRLRLDWLRAIEAMNVKLVPASVLNNYLSAYARHLGLRPDELIARFELQCGAISEAGEQAIDTTPKDHLPKQFKWASIAAAALLVIGGMSVFGFRALNAGSSEPIITADATGPVIAPSTVSAPLFDDETLAAVDAEAAPPLEIVALRKAWIEVRGADGTVFRERIMARGETYRPRLGAGWTVTARDAGAFAWSIEGTEVAALGVDDTPAYAISVDAAARAALDTVQPMTASVAEGSPSR